MKVEIDLTLNEIVCLKNSWGDMSEARIKDLSVTAILAKKTLAAIEKQKEK